jgi:diguanylate cyclase
MAGQKSFPPVYTEHDAQKASENLRQIIPLINKHKTPVNPVNYAVWYEYVSGDNGQLNKALDERLNSRLPITTELTQALYEKYVLLDMPDRLDSANAGISKVVNQTLLQVNKAQNVASECASDLSGTQDELSGYSDINELKSIVSSILSNTQTLTSTSQDLKSELEQSSREIELLKSELEMVKEISRTDGLTGLLNRRTFDQELEKICKQQQYNVGLILFDLDNFKNLNDTMGHLVGDKVLQYFSRMLNKYAGERHIAARYGGEEMVMIIFDKSNTETLSFANKVRVELAESRLKHKKDDSLIGPITVSAGISFFQAGDTPHSFLDRADQGLYSSKNAGRNRVTVN